MFALDLFNTDHERRLAEGAVDRLEQRRIDDLAMKMDDLVARAKTATTPEAKAALVKEFQKCKAERDSYFKIKDECMGYGGVVGEAGIGQDIANKQEKMARATPSTPAGKVASTVKNAAKWLAGKGGPGKEGPTYEGQDQKKNSEVTENQRLHVGDPVIVTAPNEFEGKTGEISEFSPSGKFVVVNLYNYGEHSMHLSDIEYNQYADKQEEDDWYDNEVEEGWSNKMVARRTGQAPTPYSVYIKGKEWKSFADDDHAENVANKLRAKFKQEGKDPSVITIAPTGYDKGLEEVATDYSKRRQRERDVDAGKPVAKQRQPRMTDYQRRRAQQKKDMELGEGKADYNFDVEDLKRLERIRDLPTLKTQALALISKPSAKPMKPEKVEWFKNALERMNSPMKVIKLMYDLLLSGEGHAVVGSKSSMNPNSYRQRFGEQDESDNDSSGVERAILNRIMVAHTDLLMKFGPEKVMQAAEEVAYNVGDVDEIGTSDVSAYVNQVRQILGVPEELDEKWSQKYKDSINCANPKGFSQRAHCAGRKK